MALENPINPCIGTAKGPGETPHEYTFVTPDTDESVKNGEFVYYEANVAGSSRQIVGRVTQRRPIRLYPDSFMADPRVPPGHVAGMLGYHADPHELFEITVRILGFYEPALGDFINPRLPPRAGKPVHLCSDDLLAKILSKRTIEQRGSIHVGSLLSRDPGSVPIVIDASAFTSTHLAIIASTGAGKSYLAGVMLEELMKPHNRACVLIIDPHGEYSTLEEMANHETFTDEAGYRPNVRVFKPEQVKVRVNTLDMGDYRALLPNLSERQGYVLNGALRDLGKETAALASYQRAIALDSTLAEAHFKLASILQDRRRHQQALKHFAAATKTAAPKTRWLPDAYFALTKSAQRLRRKKRAIAALKKYLEIAGKKHPTRPEGLRMLQQLGGSIK